MVNRLRLRDLVNRYSWKAIDGYLKQMGVHRLERFRMYEVWKEVKDLSREIDREEKIEICMDVDAYYMSDKEHMHVYGRTENEEEIDLSFYDWKDWLNFRINEYLKYVLSEVEILIFCLKEMKTWGLSRQLVLKNVGLLDTENYIGKKDNVIYLRL